MIHVQTEAGDVRVDATAKDVTTSAGHLKIHRDGQVVAQFRDWTHWHETEKESPND